MWKALATAGMLALMGLAPAANAVPVSVTYSVSSLVTIPALGNAPLAQMNGLATIEYQNASALGSFIFDGDMRFMSFSVTGNLILNLGTPVQLTGPIGIHFGPLAGTPGVGASNQSLNVSSGVSALFAGTASGLVHCTGVLCGTPTLPFPGGSVFVPLALPFSALVANLNSGFIGNYLGNANLNNSGAPYPAVQPQISLDGPLGSFGGLGLFVNNQLTEVTRSLGTGPGPGPGAGPGPGPDPIPEPSAAILFSLGALVLAGSLRQRR
jgi:hypothetical protein